MASDARFRRFVLSVSHHAYRGIAAFILLLCIFLVSFPSRTDIQVLLDDETDLPYIHEFGSSEFKPGHELQLKGINHNDSVLTLIIRIDNSSSRDYRTRYNREFSIQPGAFSLTIPMTGLKTSGKTPLLPPYTQMIIFNAGSSDGVVLTEAHIAPPPPRPKQVLALDFGKEDSPVFPGFEPVTHKDKRLSGELLQRFRPAGDSLLQDGLEGIDSLTLPWENGQWKLTLWLQEQGEWEYLPHFQQRKVVAENQTVLQESYNSTQWISDVYLAGTRQEALIDGDAWELIGKRRTKPVTSTVTITDNTLDIQWTGDRSARYAAGLVLEPLDGQFAAEAEKQRQKRFVESWPVTQQKLPRKNKLQVTDESPQPATNHEDYRVYPVARNSLLNMTFQISTPEADPDPIIAIANPRNVQGQKLNIQTRYGHWRFERPEPNANNLIVADSYLRSDLNNMTLSPELPRNLYLQVGVPSETEPGIYKGNLQLLSKGALRIVEFAVDVMPVNLPGMTRSVGLYLEPAPFYEWFPDIRKRKPFATACDLALLASMGFTNVAPALDTPTDLDLRKKLVDQLKQLRLFGFEGPTMAYAPLKRLLAAQPIDEAMKSLSNLREKLSASLIKQPYWSIYDEPHPESFPKIRDTANRLHMQSLDMKTAGHLNNPRQHGLLSVTDLAIMNHGYGVSKTSIENLQRDRIVWLYNMPDPRLAAGFYLWKSDAEGYLQWHGRMPTADPFDPTDGREGDVIYLYPWQAGCPDTMNIHKRLLDLHEATLDLRWLQWLDEQAENNEEARNLAEKLRSAIPDDWEEADKSLSAKQLMLMRKTIMEMAHRLTQPL